MDVIFKTFNVGNGDCIALLLSNNGQEIHILVDCGKFTAEVNEFICNRFNNTIDYLIVTHIDNDHIVGLIEMLSKNADLEISQIIYNCYQRIPNNPQPWDEKMKENILRVTKELPIIVDLLEYKISEEKAKTLAEKILTNERWKNVWKREYTTSQSIPIELSNDMGKLIFLSPTQEALDKIDHLYRKLFWEKLYKGKSNDYDKEETIYEALLRSFQDFPEDSEFEISTTELTKEALLSLADRPLKNTSLTNQASIAFIWEKDEHRILFLGDAAPKEIYDSINRIYATSPKPLLFDAVKVSHHGSAENTSKELTSIADSQHFFFTGKTNNAPSIYTIARIVTAPLTEGIKSRKLNFNRASVDINLLRKNTDLQEEFNFELLSNTQYEFSF